MSYIYTYVYKYKVVKYLPSAFLLFIQCFIKNVLQLSDLIQICVVLFDNLFPFRRQLHNTPLLETPFLICEEYGQALFTSFFYVQLYTVKGVCHGQEQVVITWRYVWAIWWMR